MLSGAALRKLSLILSPLLLAGVLAVVVVRQRLGSSPAAKSEKEHAVVAQNFLEARGNASQNFLEAVNVPVVDIRPKASKWSEGVTIDDIGIFSGLKIEQDFKGVGHWERRCPIHVLSHGTDGDQEVYTGAYNECTGVSDVVYYKVEDAKFESGAGRYSGWKNDERLVEEMDRIGKSQNEYATVPDYKGVGLFGIDRGHQAPVGSFNADEQSAKMTNTPTNLSPQNGYLNQKAWMYLEKEMRFKATQAEELVDEEDDYDEEDPNSFELLTGPLYTLPDEFFENENGKKQWEDLLWRGGPVNQRGQTWCKRKTDDGFENVIMGKKTKITCDPGRNEMSRPSDDPNKLQMHFHASDKHFPLRIPLGYFKLAVINDESSHGRQTCPYIMDQTGQCMLVSLNLLLELAHINIEDTPFADEGGTAMHRDGSNHLYSANVDPDFCINPKRTLAKKGLCFTGSHDAEEVTIEMMESYWDDRKAAEKSRR